MFRWLRSPRSEIDTGLSHTIVAVAAMLALACGLVAVGVALANDGDDGSTIVATDAAAAARAPALDVAGDPPEGWHARDPVLAPAPGGTEHAVTLRAVESRIEVAPGTKQMMWSFDGQVPGPVLRGKIGDLFTITLVNDGENAHSIDFHASKVAPDDEMRSIAPGESLVYQFVAKHSGIWMYHCGTPPVLHHVGNGMYGAIVIDPPDLARVDYEYLFVQSELYAGAVTEAGFARMQRSQWDAVVFNGYPNQYLHEPIRVEPGERIRAWVLDAGPSENSSFHVIGTIFDTVYREGGYTLRPGPLQGGSQALDLQPAQGGFVEFTFDERGHYPFLTHKLATASEGAIGAFQAGEPRDDAAPGGH